MDLSIIIVSWNVKDLLRNNIKTIIEKTRDLDYEIFVVDNDSQDGSSQMVRDEFGDKVQLIANNFNAGFAKANNQAIQLSKGRYVLLLNPDMRVHENTLQDMVKWMDEHPEAGVAGCHLIGPKGETVPHVRRWPTLKDQAAIIAKVPHVFPKVLDHYMQKDFDYTKESVVDSIRGSFFMIRREVIDKLGGLDERYFIWFEEVDYCKQVQNAGWKVMYTPSVKCTDYVGKSFSQVMRFKTQKMFTTSMLKYFKKWHGGVAYTVLAVLRPFGLGAAWLADKFSNQQSVISNQGESSHESPDPRRARRVTSHDNLPKVAIIQINYKTHCDRFLARSYESLMKLNYPKDKYKIYIADNVTSPETQQRIKELAPEAVVVPSEGNGWGHGNNICVKKAIEDGYDDYYAIVNMDTIFDPNFLQEAVKVAENSKDIGIVQSKLLLYPPNENGECMLNSKGNMLTFLGFGYCAGDGVKDDVKDEVVEIVTAAGAGALVKKDVFEKIGMCDESYFMYHDDIEMSFKARLMGYKNVLAPRSVIYHEHEFGRSIRQVYYMERNRFKFILESYKWPTILLITPACLIMELGMIPFVIKNKWILTKLRVYGYFLRPSSWKEIFAKRKFYKSFRKVSDKELLKGVVARVDFQQVNNPLLKYIANPMFSAYWYVVKRLIRW